MVHFCWFQRDSFFLCMHKPSKCTTVGACCKHRQDYHDLMVMVVCDLNTKMCMIHRCANYPGDNNLREYLDGTFADSDEEEISFQQWQGTDRAMLCTQTISIIEFLDY